MAKLTEKRIKIFLEEMSQTGDVRAASQAAGCNRRTFYRLRDSNPQFASEWDDAEEDSTDILVEEARQRAMDKSDQLLMFLIKGKRPQYADRDRNNGKGGDTINYYGGFPNNDKKG